MKTAFKDYEKTIKKQHQLAWKPQYKEEFRTSLTAKEFVAVALLSLQELEWAVVYYDNQTVEAKTPAKGWHYGHKITISFQHGKAVVHSLSSEDWLWDKGINSKRVKLFIHAFQETAQATDTATIAIAVQEIEAANSWKEYEVPKTLPSPKERPTPKPWLVGLGSLVVGIALGVTLAGLTYYWTYYIIAFELVAGLLLAGAFNKLIKWSHYTALVPLHLFLGATVLLSFVVHCSFYYYYFLLQLEEMPAIGLFSYLQLVLESGFVLDGNNWGTIGVVLSWLVQIGLTYGFAQYFLSSSIKDYKADRVPPEVLLFAQYQFSQQKNEESVKVALSKMGWKAPEDQEDVLAAIAIIKENQEFLRKA